MCILQLLCLVGSGQGVDDFVDVPVHDGIDPVQGQTDPVVSDPALGEIIGADPHL